MYRLAIGINKYIHNMLKKHIIKSKILFSHARKELSFDMYHVIYFISYNQSHVESRFLVCVCMRGGTIFLLIFYADGRDVHRKSVFGEDE